MADLGGRITVVGAGPPVRVTGVTTLPDRRLLLVHAHPDDESIGTGATMAHYAATGAHVTLVTCTLGEEGEIHVPALAARDDDAGRLLILSILTMLLHDSLTFDAVTAAPGRTLPAPAGARRRPADAHIGRHARCHLGAQT